MHIIHLWSNIHVYHLMLERLDTDNNDIVFRYLFFYILQE